MRRLLVLIPLLLLFGACKDSNSKVAAVSRSESGVVADQQGIYAKGQPIPIFDYSQQRASLIQINAALAKGSATWSVFYSFGKPIYVCPSIGFPIPATTQLTNPEQVLKQSDLNSSGGNVTIPQPEPIGTFTGSTSATYVICIRPDGRATVVYAEPDVITFAFPVTVKDGNVVDAGGDPSFTIDRKP